MRRAAFLLVLLIIFVSASPGAAQAPAPDESFGTDDATVEVRLEVADKDSIKVDGLGLMDGITGFNLTRNIGDVFGLGPQNSKSSPAGYETSDGYLIEADESLGGTVDGRRSFTLDVERLAVVMGRYDIESFVLRVCTPDVPLSDRSTEGSTSLVGNDSCRQWDVTRSSDFTVDLRFDADPDAYWRWLAVVALIVFLVTLPLLAVTYSLRRALKRRTAGALTVAALLALTGFGVLSIAFMAFAFVDTPVDDLAFSRGLGAAGFLVALALPALLCAFPLFAMATAVARLPKPERSAPMSRAEPPSFPPPTRPGPGAPPGWSSPEPSRPPMATAGPPLPDWLTPTGQQRSPTPPVPPPLPPPPPPPIPPTVPRPPAPPVPPPGGWEAPS